VVSANRTISENTANKDYSAKSSSWAVADKASAGRMSFESACMNIADETAAWILTFIFHKKKYTPVRGFIQVKEVGHTSECPTSRTISFLYPYKEIILKS
jgi:hypothetical protein